MAWQRFVWHPIAYALCLRFLRVSGPRPMGATTWISVNFYTNFIAPINIKCTIPGLKMELYTNFGLHLLETQGSSFSRPSLELSKSSNAGAFEKPQCWCVSQAPMLELHRGTHFEYSRKSSIRHI